MIKLFYTGILIILYQAFNVSAQNGAVEISDTLKYQIIDGFGAHQDGLSVNENWWNQLFYDDLGSTIFRVDLTPKLVSPYSDLNYFSPWFMGSSVKNVFNLEDPANPNGPEGNRVRTYTGPNDYMRMFGGRSAPIAVMGPDIEKNISYFRYENNAAISNGELKKVQLGDFKLIGSIWSPLPWLKVSSGNRYPENWWPGPVVNTPWPFVWGGNFAGGRLDVTNTPLSVFNDQALGGTGPTSSLTQFARSTAAYILGYQRFHSVKFYAVSIQNELNFEVFYNSATYPLSSQYILALKAVRLEFNKYTELKDVKIMGPEDLLGGDAYGMWEYGGPVHKNLQYLKNIAADSNAFKALDFFCIHGYAVDGVSAAGLNPRQWDWWVNGWAASPAPGIPSNVKGFSSLGKKSWMTETSGESPDWIFPKSGFPGDGAFGLGLRIHQALVSGMESAWIYWTFTDSDDNGNVSLYGLTNQNSGTRSPKYNAAKHFYKYIQPGSIRVLVRVTGLNGILASAYLHEKTGKITVVVLNTGSVQTSFNLKLPFPVKILNAYTSKENDYWKYSALNSINGQYIVEVPTFGMVTLTGDQMVTKAENNENKKVVAMYPNPFSDHLELICSKCNKLNPATIHFFKPNGTSVKSILLSDTHTLVELDGQLDNGIYLYQIQDANHTIDIGKIIKWKK